MNKVLNWLENSFAPKMQKVNNNVWVQTLKDSIMQILPFILLGSIFVMLTIPGAYFNIAGWPNFWQPFGYTMGLISLFMSFLIPFNYCEKKRFRKQRIIAGCTGIIVFLLIISPQLIKDNAIGTSHAAFGAGGMFIAMIGGIFTGYVMGLFAKFTFFNEDSPIPDFVRSWFDFLLPIGLIVTFVWILVGIFNVDIYNIIISIFKPLSTVFETPWGFMIICFLPSFIYSMGISSWVLQPITKPVYLAAIMANVAGTAQNIHTYETVYSTYLWIGGIGCTLPLVVMLMRSRSKKLKAIGAASFAPAIFNINEPVVFGAIAWNPLLMLPMWIVSLVLPLVVWIFTKVIAFAPIPKVPFEMWYMPFPFSTLMTTGGSIKAVIFLAIIATIATLIYYPFFKVYEKNEVEKELNNQAN